LTSLQISVSKSEFKTVESRLTAAPKLPPKTVVAKASSKIEDPLEICQYCKLEFIPKELLGKNLPASVYNLK
jgi:hypothetical protein